MAFELFYHPFSSFCQKALIAFYENDVPFVPRLLAGPQSEPMRELARRWPVKRFPMLVDGERQVMEATCIVEYLQVHAPGPERLIPDEVDVALEVRMLDRVFDHYVSTPQQTIVFSVLRPPEHRDHHGEGKAREMLEVAYDWLEQHLEGRTWAAGNRFSLADCAAAPALFYADWTHAIGSARPNLTAYRQRLLARPSFARAVDEARPFRPYFPLGAPDRD